MIPIQPTGDYSATPVYANQAAATGQAATLQTASTVASTSSVTSLTTIQQQVGTMLNTVSPALDNNQYLKLLIAMLILNTLLNENGSASQGGQGAMNALETLTGGRNNALFMAVETATNTVQVQQQSLRLDTIDAAQSAWQSSQTTDGSGQKMDLSA